MALNFVRGFRRIGWVIAFPLSALFVAAFYEETKEFSPSEYVAVQKIDSFVPDESKEISLPDLGNVYFSKMVPVDVTDMILNDFKAKHKPEVKEIDLSAGIVDEATRTVYLDEQGNPITQNWEITVHKQVNKLSLAGLILGSFGCVALIIQGSISILAWIIRGFK